MNTELLFLCKNHSTPSVLSIWVPGDHESIASNIYKKETCLLIKGIPRSSVFVVE